MSKMHGALAGLTLTGLLVFGVSVWQYDGPGAVEAAGNPAATAVATVATPQSVPEPAQNPSPEIQAALSPETEASTPALIIEPVRAAGKDPNLPEIKLSVEQGPSEAPGTPEIKLAAGTSALALADEFGVSRPIVREALERLASA